MTVLERPLVLNWTFCVPGVSPADDIWELPKTKILPMSMKHSWKEGVSYLLGQVGA